MEDIYNEIFHKAKIIALRYIADENIAEEIAQLTLIQYYFNEKNILREKRTNWIFKVSKNFCMNHFNSNNKQAKLYRELMIEQVQYHDNSEKQKVKNNSKYNEDNFSLDNYDFLSVEDKKILNKYLYVTSNIKKLSQDFKIKEMTLRNKIRNLLKEIEFFHLLERKVIGFETIPGTKFHYNIRNCLRKITSSLNSNNINLLVGYFKSCKINDGIDSINIQEIKSYKIRFDSDSSYNLIIAYIDFSNNLKFFDIKFKLTDNFSIHILEFPRFPKKVYRFNEKYVDETTNINILQDQKGVYNNIYGTPDLLVRNKIAKICQIGEKLKND